MDKLAGKHRYLEYLSTLKYVLLILLIFIQKMESKQQFENFFKGGNWNWLYFMRVHLGALIFGCLKVYYFV